MIRQIDKSRFNIPLSGVLRPEIAWYATADDTVLGVVLDLDEGYSWLVLTESDQGQGFAAIDTGGSLTEEDATAALHTFSSTNQPKHRRAGDKIPRNVKEEVIAGLAAIGEDGKGKNGLRGYVTFLGQRHPKQAARLLERLLPPSVVIANNNPAAQISKVTVVSIPSGQFLSSAELDRLKEPRVIDHEPELLEAPMVEAVEPIAIEAQSPAPLNPEASSPDISLAYNGIEPRSAEEARWLAKLNTLSDEELARRVENLLVD